MAGTLVERVLTWLHETFPERQVYIRSEGRVQFYTFGPVLQGTVAAAGMLFLGWVAFATVNVIFKDRIISAKEHRYQQMQVAYENRVADLQLSYDEVHNALASAEDKFQSVADELQAKQDTILGFLGRKRQVDATLNGSVAVTENAGDNPAGPADDITPDAPALRGGDDAVEIDAPPPKQQRGKPRKSSLIDFGGTVEQLTGALFGKPRTDPLSSATVARHPVLKRLAKKTERLRRIDAAEISLMADAEGQAAKGVKQLQMLLRRTSIKPDEFEQRIAGARGAAGGPEIPLDQIRVEGVADQAFQQAYMKAYATLDQLDTLLTGIRHLPLVAPVTGPSFYRNDGFGPRRDPFTGRYAFHSGIDFDGPKGSPIHATAPGRVIWCGGRGAYGNMVEIDHGYGIRTRYGHLMSISVKQGARVTKGSVIGRLGSTGRSTGPHVHYEVWYENVVRNPRNFIEAGRYVLKQG